jgi:FixJ family two-component response regulator
MRPSLTVHSSPASGPLPLAPGHSPLPTVFVVDDDASSRRAVTRLLRAAGFAVETFASAAEFLARPPADGPGCILLDLQMPGLSGIELQEALVQARRRLVVVFLTGHGDIPASVQAMRRGAEDFLTKTAPKERLLDAVRRALARSVRENAEQARRDALRARFAMLSPRELDVLQRVLQGRLNKQIADELNIHERTVKLHRTAITTKLGVPSVAELTKLWIEAGMASEPPADLARPPEPP